MKPDRNRDRQGAVAIPACLRRSLTVAVLVGCLVPLAGAQQLLGPARQSAMQDANLKPALPGALKDVGIDQKLNQSIPLDLDFKDEYGQPRKLRDFFRSGKPVILAPVYYRCPMLCTQILNAVAGTLKAVSLDPGK